MSDQDENVEMDEQLSVNNDDNENEYEQNNDDEKVDVLQQITELARKQEEVMTVIS